jgi:hypothetical protein
VVATLGLGFEVAATLGLWFEDGSYFRIKA